MEPTERAIRNGLALLTASLRQNVDDFQVRAYLRGLKDLPAEVIFSAAERLASTPVRTGEKRFFPSVPEWAGACADIVDERRASAARLAKALQDECPECLGSGWANAEGPNAVIRCRCITRGLELLKEAGEPLKRPALPPYEPEPAA